MSEIRFEALPAKNGDCLIVELINDATTRRILVDGGPNTVYTDVLRSRLRQLQTADSLGRRRAGVIDLLMISHIDDDHINGVLDLLNELENARDRGQWRFLKIRKMWHNSFQALLGVDNSEIKRSILAGFGAATLSGAQIPCLPSIDRDESMLLASVGQGIEVENLAERLRIDRNYGAPDGLISSVKGRRFSPKFSGFDITVIGPLEKDVKKLSNKFEDHLREKGLLPSDPEAALAATRLGRDSSPTNLASIVVMITGITGKLLLTGDARWDKIIEGLKQHELLSDESPLFVDIFKLPHHGSERNARPVLFESIIADHYVASGDGLHGNPDRRTFEMLFQAQPSKPFTIHLTYPIQKIDAKRKKDVVKHGKRWRHDQDSLQALFEDKQAARHPFTLNEGDGSDAIRISLS